MESKPGRLTTVAAIGAVCALPVIAEAETASNRDAAGRGSGPSSPWSAGNDFKDWFARANQTQAEQPHWITPLVTITPRLEEELRYDQSWKHLPGGETLTSFGGGKGLELIPAERIEVIVGIPAWESENTSPGKEGWADENLLIKYRLLAANEERGNFIVTAFLGLSVPTGSGNFTTHHCVATPTIAFGKGWGDFDLQGTFGISGPDNGSAPAGDGTPLLLNAAFQYRVGKHLWPEVEVNHTDWPNGRHEGLDQVFITPGLVVGRIPIAGRLGLTFGAGYQVAATDHPLYRHNWVLSARLPF